MRSKLVFSISQRCPVVHEILDVRIALSFYLQLCFDVGSSKCLIWFCCWIHGQVFGLGSSAVKWNEDVVTDRNGKCCVEHVSVDRGDETKLTLTG